MPETTLAELTHHNSTAIQTIRYTFDKKSATILDLTNSTIARKWGYMGGNISSSSQAIGAKAMRAGYDVILFSSERGEGLNLAVFKNFDNILKPQMIVPSPLLHSIHLEELQFPLIQR